jgi:hypothetical protein
VRGFSAAWDLMGDSICAAWCSGAALAPLGGIAKSRRFVSVNATLDELDSLFECHQLASAAVVDNHQKLRERSISSSYRRRGKRGMVRLRKRNRRRPSRDCRSVNPPNASASGWSTCRHASGRG